MSGHRSARLRSRDSDRHMDTVCWPAPGGGGGGEGGGCVLSKLVQLPSPPLSRHQLKRLDEHRYRSAGRSLLEPIMQCYWEWLVARVPVWIAPNLITIVGLVTNIFTTLVLVYYCPTATEQAPLWAYLSYPQGLQYLFVVLGTCIAVQLGTNPDWMFFCCFAGMFMFYCAHWQTYVSGTLRFGMHGAQLIFIGTIELL
ncbi:UNVERIFIED_CONTAM: hypothetical protein FKN15_037840 [Acipenser sinensis]